LTWQPKHENAGWAKQPAESRNVHPATNWNGIPPLFLFRVFLNWVEYLQPRAPEISVISCDNRQIMTASSRGDIAVFDWHSLACQLKSSLLVRSYMRYRYIEAVNAPMHRLDKTRQPCLQALFRFSVFAPHPIGELRYYDSTCLTVVLLGFKPRNDSRVPLLLCRLTQNVSIQ